MNSEARLILKLWELKLLFTLLLLVLLYTYIITIIIFCISYISLLALLYVLHCSPCVLFQVFPLILNRYECISCYEPLGGRLCQWLNTVFLNCLYYF
uniref:Uncharacterized protein n=1 Tax=Gasterosteus aculeatus TaxID=69293 RepID=G3PN09_GASAC